MISANLRFEGFDATSWTNLVSLFMPGLPDRLRRAPDPSDAPAADLGGRASGSVLVVVDEAGQVLAATHSQRGRIRELGGTTLELGSDAPLVALAARCGAHRVLALREGVMEELAERLALRFRADDTYVAQILETFRAARELEAAGQLRLWPNPLQNVPLPSAQTLGRAVDVLLPDGRAAVMALWDGDLWTALVLRRRHGEIDLVAGPELLTRWTGPLGGDWRRDYRVMVDAVARMVAPVHVGLFAETPTVRGLLREADAGAWAREVAVRNVVMTPMPRAFMAALGADAVRGVGKASARALGGLDVPKLFGSFVPIVREVRARVSHARSVTEILGFDPLAVLGAALRRDGGDVDDGEAGDTPEF
ncbi:MAG: hypothetical protein KF901_31655 [Myxococcales bacterium]|nr:hypothetical protein [Myxococcales bacterium]